MASETTKAPPKGILKKPATSSSDSANADGSAVASALPQRKRQAKTPDPRDVAIQHAKIIHDRRLLEETITDSIILLAKLPNTLPPPPDPSSPSTTTPADVFKSHVRLFQPSDYDDLIEERNALGLCGYALCPRPRQQLRGGAGPYKILNWGRADFAIAPRAEVERWCSFRPAASSSSCARRAMYVKVQLTETAAVERAGIDSIRIELLEEVEEEQRQRQQLREREREKEENEKGGEKENKQEGTEKEMQQQHESGGDADADSDTARQAARDLENLQLAEETERKQKAAKDARDLALERGDTDTKKAAKRPVEVTIREKRVVTMPVQEPSLAAPGSSDGHLVLDGYKTNKFNPKTPEAISSRRTAAATPADTTTNAPVKEEEAPADHDAHE
ncbi:hypothetical protein SLS62_004284 [Diatrype stigma]|uniref:RNA polymerase II subunit B1 CTD phosphatase RPAP2 homolog n=1 Tax=Diatrype stigma TaxID=117547 RepID=A0AAN9YT70_9PEZI